MNIKILFLSLLIFFPVVGYSQVEDNSELERVACYEYNRYGRDAFNYCRQDSNCQWRNNRCEDRFSPRPAQCQNIRDYNRCLSTPSCAWDQRRGCVRDNGGGGWALFECSAADRGWEEHRGGHFGQGRTQWEAQNSALRACQQSHGNCFVRSCRRIR